MCRLFLWNGQPFTQNPKVVACDDLYLDQSKPSGGLGFRDVRIWKVACSWKYGLFASKKNNVWIKWVHSVYIKGENWWDYSPKSGGSWYWNKIFQIKK